MLSPESNPNKSLELFKRTSFAADGPQFPSVAHPRAPKIEADAQLVPLKVVGGSTEFVAATDAVPAFVHPTGEVELRLVTESALPETQMEIVLATIRDNIRNVPVDQRQQMFSEFRNAVHSNNHKKLADVVANWALGGHGYSYAGVVVNRTLDNLPNIKDDPDLNEAWQEREKEKLREAQ